MAVPDDLYNYTCSNKGLLLPLINEYTWSTGTRAFLYLAGLLYCFLGVAIIADIFMCSIEKITAKTRTIRLSTANPNEPELVEVKVWNDTVANLTLMALGSSAPEILLSCIEVVGNGFQAGELGPGTIVGSAAFNLLIITAVCIAGIPKGEVRRVKSIKVFGTTAFFCVFAYVWLLIILLVNTPNVVDLWEAVMTFVLFPVCVLLAYMADKDLCGMPKIARSKQLELGFMPDKERSLVKDGKINQEALVAFVKEVKKYPGLSDEEAAMLAASSFADNKPKSRMWYRIGAIRELSGSRKTQLRLVDKLKGIKRAISKDGNIRETESRAPSPTPSVYAKNAVVEFNSPRCAILESAGKVAIIVVRRGQIQTTCRVRVETLDGTASANEDYMPINEVVVFGPGETEKEVFVTILDDTQWEPDEEFFLRLSLLPNEGGDVTLGRTAVMEVIILNDDEPGVLQFKRRGLLVQETVGTVHVAVERAQGADGEVSIKWRTIDKSAISGKDFVGGGGVLVFKSGEIEMNIEVDIINDMNPEKDEHFEIELYEATGGAQIGKINRTTVTITNDDDFNNVMTRVLMMTNANVDAMRVEKETWVEQIKDAMNVNGGDLEGATWGDYLLHFCTFGWKILFSLVPPPSLCGGWLCFIFSLAMIGLLTAVIGDFAGIFGCLVGLPDAITAITFVAAGTSLPDLFASKTAARMEKYADSAIGNVTGSNSVNVFLGLGLPWFIASAYWFSKGEQFRVEAGSLGFSVGCYTVVSIISIAILLLRRNLKVFGQAELGGPVVPKYICMAFILFLWFMYILLSSLQALKIIVI